MDDQTMTYYATVRRPGHRVLGNDRELDQADVAYGHISCFSSASAMVEIGSSANGCRATIHMSTSELRRFIAMLQEGLATMPDD